MRRATLLAFCLFAFSGYSQCDSVTDQKVSDGANCFTLNMYKELAKTADNVVSSPFSLDILLSMLFLGAGGKTAQELSTALGYNNISADNIANSFQSKMNALRSSDDNTLEIANSIWLQQSLHFEQSFKTLAQDKFYSEANEVDFRGNSSGVTQSINSWGSEKTHGLIPTLLDKELHPSTIMFLVNAIYFKGQWASKFEKTLTEPGTFKNNDSSSSPSTVPLMNQRREFNYHFDSALGAQVLEMDYKGNNMSMVLMLPQEGSTIDSLERSLTCQTFQNGIGSGSSKLVDVTLPKFELSSSFQLINPIQSVGIEDIFKPSANLSGIAQNIFVTEAIQKAVIKVYEEGSEAAVLTGIGVNRIASFEPQPQLVYFRADHPFLFLIRDKRTGLVLFMGRVKNLPNSS